MGRKLTEGQKVERAARRIEQKERDQLGPLFAHQAEAVDRDALRQERRWGWANSVEHIEQLCGGPKEMLDLLALQGIERLARERLPAEDVAALTAYARRVYPSVDYWIAFWLDVLAGKTRAAVRRHYEPGPPKTLTLKGIGGQVNTVTIPTGKVVDDEVLPREGWTSPFPNGWRDGQLWQRCSACKRWHGPGQLECIGAAVVDGVQLDADAERVLGSIRPAA